MSTGIDDAESECDLDNFTNFNFYISNNGDTRTLEQSLEVLINKVLQMANGQIQK